MSSGEPTCSTRPQIHDDDRVGGCHRLALIVRDIDRRVLVGVVQAPDLEAHLLAQIGVEIRERFVEQQRLRFDDERPRQRRALLLAAGQFMRIARREIAEPRHVEDRRDPALALGPVEAAQLEPVGDILGDRHMRPQRITLEDHRHAAPLRRHRAARLRDGAAADPDRALVGIEKPGDEPQRRRLAATRGPSRQTSEPCAIVKLSESSATAPPKCFVSDSSSTAAITAIGFLSTGEKGQISGRRRVCRGVRGGPSP